MKITLQTLKGTKYEIEVKETDLVQDVKQRCETEFDLGDAATMKLIHAGKILKDKDTIEASKVKNGDFLVVMVPPKKPGAPAAKKPTSPTPVPTSGASQAATTSTSAPSSPTPAVTTSQTTGATTSGTAPATTTTGTATAPTSGTSASTSGTQAVTGTSGPGSAQTQASANSLVMGADYEAMVANLMGLGFSHEKVVQALRASFNNPDRAAEYLFNGIPESVLAQLNAQGGAGAGAAAGAGRGQSQAGQGQAGSGAGRGSQAQGQGQGAGSPSLGAMLGASGAGNPLAALNSPEFAQLRQMIQANPGILPLLLQQLQQSNPQLFQMIGSNPAAMAQMMQALGVGGAGQGSGSGSGDVSGGSTSPSSQGQSGQGGQGGSRGGQVIQITQEEKAALDRLEALGFSKQKALEAFLLCERNEELAANYLFDHAHDEVGGGDDAGAD